MAFDFPASPTVGQSYKPVGGPTFAWDGVAWKAEMAGVPVSVYVADSAPPNPAAGQLWWDSDSGNLFIWFADPDSTQWVQVSGMPATDRPTALARNRVVNGACQISQELAGGNAVTGQYPVDQFMLNSAIATVVAVKQPSGAVHPTGDTENIYTYLTTAKPSLAAADSWLLQQPVEGLRTADFRWGIAGARQVVVRFTCRASQAGTFTFNIKSGALDQVFMAPFTLAATTWQEVVIVVPGATAGTWATDNTKSMTLTWALAAGSNINTGVAGWSATGSGQQITGGTNLAATANASFYLGRVGMYLDPDNTGLAPAWTMPNEAEEEQVCWRYFVISSTMGTLWSGNATAGLTYSANWNFAVRMRATPAVSGVNSAAGGFPAVVGTLTSYGAKGMYEARIASTGGGGSSYYSTITANARM